MNIPGYFQKIRRNVGRKIAWKIQLTNNFHVATIPALCFASFIKGFQSSNSLLGNLMKKILAEGPRYKAAIGLLAAIAFPLFLPPGVSWPQQEKNLPAAKTIKDIVLSTRADAVQVEIKGDGFFVNYSIIRLSDPPRLVLDFPGMVNALSQSSIAVGHAVLKEIRIGKHPQKTRIVFEFSGEKIPLNQIHKNENTLILLFGKTSSTGAFLSGKKEAPVFSEQSKESKVEEGELSGANNSPLEVGKREPGPSQGPTIQPEEMKGEEGRKDATGRQKHIYKGKKISLEFSDSDIRLVFQKIAKETNQNIVVSDSVQGRISLRLIDVPWDQALDIILESQHLAISQEGNILRIVAQKGYDQKKE